MHRNPSLEPPARSRRIKAVLAGGTVLGIGAVFTLAAWSDDVWAGAQFSAGTFSVQSSPSGEPGTFLDYSTEQDSLPLDFQVDTENLGPGDTVAAPMVIRIAAGSSYDATVTLDTAASSGENAAHFTYGLSTVDAAADCTTAETGTELVPSDTSMTSIAGDPTFSLDRGTESTPGPEIALCFRVTAGEELIQGESASALWQFVASSVE